VAEHKGIGVMDTLQRALGGVSGGRVLDVATGEGSFIKTLLENLKSYSQIIGIDACEPTRTPGSVFDTKAARFVQMDAAQLGFSDGSFDTVSISSSLHQPELIIIGNKP
jgi:ubiquinone/menaquinone biosynthesis C-methylase UbiE